MRDGSTMLPAKAIGAIDGDDDDGAATAKIAPGKWSVCCLVWEWGSEPGWAKRTTNDTHETLG